MGKSGGTRRDFLKLIGIGATTLAVLKKGHGSAEAVPGRPNVLIILADDLGYGDLSSYGATDLKSPNIDGLVAAGARFDSFYSNCPVCSPTRASLMTGRYPDLVGVPGVIRTHVTDNWGYLSPQALMLPQKLKRAGYHTALVGKWHLGLASPNTPNERSFDHFHGFLGDMMDDYYTHRRHGFNYLRLNDKEIDPGDMRPTSLRNGPSTTSASARKVKSSPSFFISPTTPRTLRFSRRKSGSTASSKEKAESVTGGPRSSL